MTKPDNPTEDESKHVQILPLSSGERNTITPLARRDIPADIVYVIPAEEDREGTILNQTPGEFLSEMMGFDVEQLPPAETFDEQYVAIYELIQQHAEEATIWINGCEVPHASMLAATVGASEYATSQGALHYYRVTDGQYEEIPLAVDPVKITPIREEILTRLANGSEAGSVSELAEELAGEELNNASSYRSKVQYNTETLAEAGFVDRERQGRKMKPELTQMGELWLETHMEASQ